MRKPAFLLPMLVITSGGAQAEVLDKIGGPFVHWHLTLISLAAAVLLAWWRPWLALLVYPFSLLLASGTLDLLYGELSPHILREGGMPFLISAYASVLVDMGGPVIAFALFRRR